MIIPPHAQADFDDAVGHRLDRLDFRKIAFEDMPARGCEIGAQDRGDIFGGYLATIGPFGFADAEDITAPVGRHGPALGEPRVDLSLAVEADESLRREIEQRGVAGRQFAIQWRRAGAERTDRGDPDRPARPEQAAACQHERG